MLSVSVIKDNRNILEMTKVEDLLMGNKKKLRGNPFSSTYLALLQVLQHNPSRFSLKRSPNLMSTRPAKRMSIPDAARPRSSDSSSTAHSGHTVESKDEEFTRSLLNAFIQELLFILQCEELTKLTWPATPYYIELTHWYKSTLQG